MEGNPFHEFAKFYVNHPDCIDDVEAGGGLYLEDKRRDCQQSMVDS
ncbi:hypothetical protein [Haloarchaeobius sp. HRN-SO-5]